MFCFGCASLSAVIFADPNGNCISSNPDNDELDDPDNSQFRDFLRDNNLAEEGIKLPPGAHSLISAQFLNNCQLPGLQCRLIAVLAALAIQ